MPNNGAVSRPDNLAPHSNEAEEAVLGSLLIGSEQVLDSVRDRLTAADFFFVRNAYVYTAILAVADRGDAIDMLTVIDELKRQKRLESIGGPAHIAYLVNNTPTHIHAETYAYMVERSAVRRRLLAAASAIAQASLEENAETEDVLDRAEEILYSVTNASSKRGNLPTLRETISRVIDIVDQMQTKAAKTIGMPTGFRSLDTYWSGVEKSRFYIIAARPGVGKTSLLLSMILNMLMAAKEEGRPISIGLFSLEMNDEQVVTRLLSMASGIASQKIRLGKMDADEWGAFLNSAESLSEAGLHLDCTPGLTVPQMRARMRLWQREFGLNVIFADYLQIFSAANKHGVREGEVSEIARGFKHLSRQFNIPVISAAQINRDVEKRSNKRPTLADLRESGSIENEADVVMFIYRDEIYNPNTQTPAQAELITAKNRDGETGTAIVGYRAPCTLFYNTVPKELNIKELYAPPSFHKDERDEQ